ncbi:hypothetical protein [Natrinema versiforme]|uniref:DUF2800 domain-containing protein n=1 Tax=Natrinema versiforme JCM 10478 TaxID=1227496 RepID=L9XS46_9EURY|nr:hypothetical protein [Natrinema versiforme]ELY64575.1 hypothetical protein C489_17519 [Natrinema versiforme JCM 10478]
MEPDDTWASIRRQCEGLEPGTELLTPVSERPFEVERTDDDRIVVRFGDSGETRPLWREQFVVFLEQLDDGEVSIDHLQPGVEPYASVVTLADEYAADDEVIRYDTDGSAGESPFLVPAADARNPPERVHDDALLLAALLEELDADEPTALDTDSLTDLYVLASDVQHGSDRVRRSAREPLLERLGPDQELHGRYGTVRRTTRERRQPKDAETIFAALDERGIPREWVTGVDRDKLDVVLAVTDLEEPEVYDIEEDVYVQKTGVDEDEKYSRLQGIADRIDDLEGAEGEELRDELDDIEDRLEEALSAD